jgi:hypothetical protein
VDPKLCWILWVKGKYNTTTKRKRKRRRWEKGRNKGR